MGLFNNFGTAGAQHERNLVVKDLISSSHPWQVARNSPLFGSGIRVGFAIVDCRRCGRTDEGLLLDQTIWDMHSHKISYATCRRSIGEKWIAEYQGPQAARSGSEWRDAHWTSFDLATGEVCDTKDSVAQIKPSRGDSLEDWIVKDFLTKGELVKARLAEAIKRSDNFELQYKLHNLAEIEQSYWGKL